MYVCVRQAVTGRASGVISKQVIWRCKGIMGMQFGTNISLNSLFISLFNSAAKTLSQALNKYPKAISIIHRLCFPHMQDALRLFPMSYTHKLCAYNSHLIHYLWCKLSLHHFYICCAALNSLFPVGVELDSCCTSVLCKTCQNYVNQSKSLVYCRKHRSNTSQPHQA